MLYFGVNLCDHSFKITVLSESFAHIETRYFNKKENQLNKWIDSFKTNISEKCIWYFDEFNFNNHKDTFLTLSFDYYCSDIYLVNHRKLLNIIQFLYEWAVHTESYLTFDIDHTFILASSTRLFDYGDIKYYNQETCLF